MGRPPRARCQVTHARSSLARRNWVPGGRRPAVTPARRVTVWLGGFQEGGPSLHFPPVCSPRHRGPPWLRVTLGQAGGPPPHPPPPGGTGVSVREQVFVLRPSPPHLLPPGTGGETSWCFPFLPASHGIAPTPGMCGCSSVVSLWVSRERVSLGRKDQGGGEGRGRGSVRFISLCLFCVRVPQRACGCVCGGMGVGTRIGFPVEFSEREEGRGAGR